MKEYSGEIAIITDDPGWHGRQLQLSLKKDHGLASKFISLTDCAIHLSKNDSEIILPGFKKLPLGVFVRGVPGGSLEQVIFRLDILHALHELGVTVYNTPKAIERTVDKALTSFLLNKVGVPTPETWIIESQEQAQSILDKTPIDTKLILKPLFGSQGNGIHLVDRKTSLVCDEKFAGIYYVQKFIDKSQNYYGDIRVFVIDKIAQAAMLRRSSHWLTNRAQGAICESIDLTDPICKLAEKACHTLNIDYAGVDLILDGNDGKFYVIEVNSIPAWYGLQKVVDFNIASSLISSFVKHIY